MDKQLFNLIHTWMSLNEQKKDIESQMKPVNAAIVKRIRELTKDKERPQVTLGDIKATVVPVQRLTIHDHALQENFPELYERSLKPNTTALKKAAEVLGVPIAKLEEANAVTVKHTHRLDIRGKAL